MVDESVSVHSPNWGFEIHTLDFAWEMFEKTNDVFWIRVLMAWCKDFRRNNFA
jgi:hypothetical protein